MKLPRKALRKGSLKFENSEKVKDSSHTVRKVTFVDENGDTKKAFFKDLDENYPEFLAKYAVAYSLFLRSMVGSRAAEDRLVYDDECKKVIGTISIAKLDYLPFAGSNEDISTLPTKTQRQMNPTVEDLLKENFMELMVAQWISQDDDRHPKNASLKYLIDFDMARWPITHVIKGKRFSEEWNGKDIKQSMKFKEHDFIEFPVREEPTYWMTKIFNGSIDDRVRGLVRQDRIYKCVEAMRALAKNPTIDTKNGKLSALDQMYNAILKCLLTLQPKKLQADLIDYFGTESLGFSNLKREQQEELTRLYPKLFDFDEDISCVDYFKNDFQHLYDSFYRCCVFFEGFIPELGDKEHKPRPSFNKYLSHRPSAFNTIKTWVIEQNKLLDTQKETVIKRTQDHFQDRLRQGVVKLQQECTYRKDLLRKSSTVEKSTLRSQLEKYDDEKNEKIATLKVELQKDELTTIEFIESLYAKEKRYKLDTLEKKYHQIYRDSYFPRLRNVNNALITIIKEVSGQLGKESVKSSDNTQQIKIGDIEFMKSTRSKESDTVTSVSQLLGEQLTSDVPLLSIVTEESNDLNKGLDAIIPLQAELFKTIKKYYGLTELTHEDNKNFYMQLHEFACEIDDLNRYFGKNNEWGRCVSFAYQELMDIQASLPFARHLTRPDKDLSDPKHFTTATPIMRECHTDEVAADFIKALFLWAEKTEPKVFRDIVNNVLIHEYKPSSYNFFASRTRGATILPYLKREDVSNADKLAFIFSEGGLTSTSLNTKLIDKIAQFLIDDKTLMIDLSPIRNAMKPPAPSFQADYFAKKLQAHVNKQESYQIPNSPTMIDKIAHAMYEWCNNKDDFNKYITNIHSSYKSGLSWWTTARDIGEYLSKGNNCNGQILFVIFSERGTEENSLNTILFNQVLKDMLKDDVFCESHPWLTTSLVANISAKTHIEQGRDSVIKGLTITPSLQTYGSSSLQSIV
jgi:hypothetical protein